MRLLYTVLLYVLLPIMLLRERWRAVRAGVPAAPLADRLGYCQAVNPGVIWVHCVSVGETVAAVPLVEALLAAGEEVLMTSTTCTGFAHVRSRFQGRVRQCFMPVDTPGAVSRFLTGRRPRMLVILETELWPNLLFACAKKAIPALLVNARLSEKSAKGYARLGSLSVDMLQSLTVVAAQAERDAMRFRALGVLPARLHVTGNLKFDVPLDACRMQEARDMRQQISVRPVWVAASTHAGEDEIVLAAHRDIVARFPTALLVLVPRHPERFGDVAGLAVRAGFSVVRRSSGRIPQDADAVWLGDSMGEMSLFYGMADVAFVGGSLISGGGHNLVEPAACGLPVLSGPYVFNFAQVAEDLTSTGALKTVTDGESLASAVLALFGSATARRLAGEQAAAYVAANQGACAQTLALINGLLRH